MTQLTQASTSSPRLELIDVLRGLAILGVVLFHTVWDLRFFGFTQYDPFWDPIWLGFAKVLINSFLALAGFSFVIANERGVVWPSFRKRLLVLTVCALGVSLITFFAFADGFVYFGVLHALAVFALFGLVARRLPSWALIVAALLVIVPPHIWQSAQFNQKALSWIGFWSEHPNTQDLVPIFPAFGTFLLGMVVARWRNFVPAKILTMSADNVVWRGLVWCGRKSLAIYLVHQPLVFGLLFVVAQVFATGPQAVATNFVGQCKQSCAAQGQEEGFCTRYCGCAFDYVEQNELWTLVERADAASQPEIQSMGRLCSAMAGQPLDVPPVE